MSENAAEIVLDETQEETQVEKKYRKYNENERRNNEKSSSICRKISKKKFPLCIIDSIISQFIVGPLIIGFWRGLWGLIYFYDLSIPDWHYFVIGSSLHWTFVIFREILHKSFAEKWKLSNYSSRIGYKMIQLVYTHLFGASCIMQWYGGWSILNSLMGTQDRLVFASTCFFIIALMMLRSSRNLMAPPFIIVVDLPNYTFNFPTRYRTAMSCTEARTQDTHEQDWRMVEFRSGGGMTTGVTLDRPTSAASSRLHYTILTLLDAIFSTFVAAPAVVGYWRGTWGLSDIYLFPNNPLLSNATSIAVGYGGLLFFNVIQGHLNDIFNPDKHRLSYYIGSRIYTAIFGFCCVNAWRGGWQALELYTEHSSSTVIVTTIVALAALTAMKAVRNISAPPFSLSLDSHPGYFEVPTMFRVDNSRDFTLYVLDCAFSVGVVGTLVVFVWRGIWVLLDYHLFPGNREYSAVGSMVIGYMLVGITFCFQPMMRYICSRLRGLSRLLAADIFLFLSFLGTVNVWRGIWGVLDLWLLPEDVELSCWITHIGCFIFLGLLNCSNSILVRGVYIDAEEAEGRCVVFPCHYLRLFFKIEREKKEARRKNLVVLLHDYEHSETTGKDAENGSLINCSQPSRVPTNSEIDMV